MGKVIHDKLNQFQPSMFMSGVESKTYWDIVVRQAGSKNVLTSYYYYREQKDQQALRKRLKDTPDVRVFIDSGAFTLMQKDNHTVEGVEEYIEHYVQWARENKDCIFAVAGMDLEKNFGIEQTLKWNKKYFEPLERDGVPVCYIWHSEFGIPLFEEYCKKYHYVGISGDIFDSKIEPDTLLRKLVSIAKKHGALIHGMAFTKTQLLLKHPLYSVDSTTWLVGQQYGELNWWDGRKMTRLKKKDWQRTYKTKLLRPPFNADWDRLIKGMGGKGDTYELLRLNVIAFIDGEDHIRKRIKNQVYWQKGAKSGMKLDRGKMIIAKLPSVEWFDSDMKDYKTYAKVLNIGVDFPKEEICNVLEDYRRFIAQDEELLEDYTEEDLIDSAKDFCGIDAEDAEDALEALKEFYIENASGDRNNFNSEASDGDSEDVRIVGKERESYLIDPDFIEDEILEKDLPPPSRLAIGCEGMDEVDAYDEELRGIGIVVERDSSGRFVKGNKVTRKQKDVYAEFYPKLVCDTCYKSGDCPQYMSGYVCAFDKQMKKFDSRNVHDIVDGIASIVNADMGRLQRAMMFEIMDGGMPTGEVSTLMDRNIKNMLLMKDIVTRTPQAIAEQRRVINADGSTEETTTLRANPSDIGGGGILSKLFSNMGANSNEDEEVLGEERVKPSKSKVIDITDYEVIDTPKKKKSAGKLKPKKKRKPLD